MSQLGNYLRSIRVSKNISLDDIQDTTKIRKVYLQAIEDGEFDRLPGAFYVRAFTKSYCEAVGASFSEVVEQFQGELKVHDPSETNEPSPTFQRSRIANVDRAIKWGSSIALIACIAVVAVLVYFLIVHFNSKEDRTLDQTRITKEAKIYVSPSPSPTPAVEPSPSQSPIASVEPGTSPTPSPVEGGSVSLVGTDSNSVVYNVEGVSEIQLVMSFTEDCWTLFRDQNSTGEIITGKLGKSTYVAGDIEILNAKNNVNLRYGNMKGVKLSLNGTKLDAPMLSEEGARNIQINLVTSNTEQ